MKPKSSESRAEQGERSWLADRSSIVKLNAEDKKCAEPEADKIKWDARNNEQSTPRMKK
jgi:hypothetical protein